MKILIKIDNYLKNSDFFLKIFSLTSKQIGIMFLAQSLVNIFNYAYKIILGRMLGPSNFGVLVTLSSIFLIFGSLSGSFSLVLTKFTSQFKAEKKESNIFLLLKYSFLGILFFSLILFFLFFIFSNKIANFLNINSNMPIIILGIAISFSFLITPFRGILRGLHKFTYLGLNLVVASLIKLILGILFVILGFGINGAIGALPLSTFISIFIVIFPLNFLMTYKVKDSSIDFKEIYKYFWPVFTSMTCFSILINTDMILVKHFFNPVEAGIYSVAIQFGNIVFFFPLSVTFVMFPKITKLFILKKDTSKVFLKYLILVLFMCLPITSLYYIAPNFMINLFFGKQYSNSANLIFFYGIAMTLYSLVFVFINYFLSINYKRISIIVLFFALVQFISIWLIHNSLIRILQIVCINSFLINLVCFFILFFERIKLNFS